MIPLALDDVSGQTERADANVAFLIGVTQASLASQTTASRAAAAQAIANNLPPGSPNNVNVPGPNVAPNYVQPDYRIPSPRAGGVVTAANPMGL